MVDIFELYSSFQFTIAIGTFEEKFIYLGKSR